LILRAQAVWTTGAALAITVLAFYAFQVEPEWIEITTHSIEIAQSDSRARVVQISDLHLRSKADREARIARTVRELKPDAIVFTGDIIDRAENLDLLQSFLSQLGPVPRVAVLGNWEHWSAVDLQRLRTTYEAVPNSSLLVNQRSILTLNGGEIEFLGLDDYTAGKPDGRLMRTRSARSLRIVLQHSPGFFGPKSPSANQSNQICLAGHTHGGQVRLFGRVLWTPPGSGDYVEGWYETAGCRLYVSRGLGMSILPIRFGSRPELSVFDF
jgi:hypothetical protein